MKTFFQQNLSLTGVSDLGPILKKCFIPQCCLWIKREEGTVHMKKTSISIIVFLVVFSLSLTLAPAAHSQTSVTNIKVLSYSYYFDYNGFLVVIGEVQNTGANTVKSVGLSGTAYSSDGEQVDSSVYAMVVDLLPRQKAPFMWTFVDTSGNGNGVWSHPDVTHIDISVYQADTTTDYQYPDLQVSNLKNYLGTNRGTGSDDQTADYGAYWVTGTLKNTGDQTAQNVRVIITYYNSSGAAVAVGGYIDQVMNTTLTPSQSTNFKIGAYDLNQTGIISSKKIAGYSVLVQVGGPILQGTEVPTVTPYPSPTSGSSTGVTVAPTSTDYSSVGGDSTDSSGWILGAVVVVAIVAVAAILLSIKKHRSSSAVPAKLVKPKK
jgi:hypothetical protein